MDKLGYNKKGQKAFEIGFKKSTKIDKRSLLTV